MDSNKPIELADFIDRYKLREWIDEHSSQDEFTATWKKFTPDVLEQFIKEFRKLLS